MEFDQESSALMGVLGALVASFVLIFPAYVPPELKNHL